MNNGWITLHRKLKDSPIYKDSQAVHLWVHLLLSANHKPGKHLIGNTMVQIPKGSLLTGRKALAEATKMHESKIRRLLKLFEKEQLIDQQTFTRYRLISITNWSQYQDTDQQTTNKRPTNDQRATTNNNGNNNNNKAKQAKTTKKPPEIKYPQELNQKAWQEYIAYRREAKIRKLTPQGEVKQIEKIISYGGYDIQQQCIDQTIANGWQGIFPPKQQQQSGYQTSSDRFLQNVRDNWSDE